MCKTEGSSNRSSNRRTDDDRELVDVKIERLTNEIF